MKFLSCGVVWLGAVGLLSIGCERHSFEETQILHLEHGGDHGDHGHGDDSPGLDHAEGKHGAKHEEKPQPKAKAEEKADAEPGAPRDVGL